MTVPVWAAIELASQGNDSPGRFDWRIHRHGLDWISDQFQSAYDLGCNTLYLHRPNGESADSDSRPPNQQIGPDPNPENGYYMSIDSRVDLMRDPDCRKVFDAQPRFLDDFHRRFPDARIVAYVGSSWEPDLAGHITDQKGSAFFDRYGRSLIPWINCPWVDLAFDFAGSLRPRNVHGAAIKLVDAFLHAGGRTAYVEPQPREWSMTADMPFLVLENWWQKHADKTRTNGVRWLEGGSVVQGYWVNDYQGWVDDCVKSGTGIAIHPVHFKTLKLPLKSRQPSTKDTKA